MGSKPFSDMSKNETHRQTFIRSAVKLLRKYKFDGLGKLKEIYKIYRFTITKNFFVLFQI